jgi:hypothetical protein
MHADFSVELGRDDPALEIPWSSSDPSVRYFDLKKCPELVLQIPEAVAHPEMSAFLTRINTPAFPLATAKCDIWDSRKISAEEEIFGDRKFVSYVDLFFVDERSRCSFDKHEALAKELCRLLNHAPHIAATVELVVRRCYYHQHQFACPRNAEEPQESGGESTKTNNVFAFEQNAFKTLDHEQQKPEPKEVSYTPPKQRQAGNSLKNESAHEIPFVHDPSTSVSGFYLTAYVSGFGDSEHEPRRRWEIAFALLQHALIQLSCTLIS